MNLKLVILASLALVSQGAFAQIVQKDTVSAEAENSAIFLNAASDSKPREISLGLPTNAASAVHIYEDGLPVSYYIYHMYPYKSWHGGVSASKTGTIGPIETAMRMGEINNYVDSWNRTGSDSFRGSLSYTYGMYGQNKLDVNVSGPLANGWQYSLSMYQNLDPGSNHLAYPKYKDHHQFYKAVISKKFADGKGDMSLVYQFVHYLNIAENFGPFIFVGDGSVKLYEGFNLGRDLYRPAEDHIEFMDFMTGEMRSMELKDGNRDITHHLTYRLSYRFDNGMDFDFRSRFKTGTSVRGAGTLSSIENATASSLYTREDGSVFTGPVQKRTIMHFDAFDCSWINNAELTWKAGRHTLRGGVDFDLNHGGTTTSSSAYAHEVKANPSSILFRGSKFFNFNTSGEYYDGHEIKYAAYFKDSWKLSDRLELDAFVRAEGLSLYGHAANNIGEDTSNKRYPGFNLALGKITDFERTNLNGAFGAEGTYRISRAFSLLSDFTFTRTHANIFNFGGFYYPNTDPTDTKFFRFGFSYQNSWLNLLSQMTYITQSNYNTRQAFPHTLQHATEDYPAGYTESVTLPITYGISSLGWITDAMINPGNGFNLHLSLTMRDPQYRDFVFSPTFSDGVTETYDFSGNNVTNLHKVEIVCDPSYSYGPWRWWLSTRYISKQYVNKTNTLFYKGRLETFGGVDYKMKKSKISLNIINLLNQKGASGLISAADLVQDPTPYQNYLLSGTFIRPFTVELGFTLDF